MRNLVVIVGDARDRYVAEVAASQGWWVKTWSVGDVDPTDLFDASLFCPVTGIDAEGRMLLPDGELRIDASHIRRLSGQGFLAAGLVADPIVRIAKDFGIRVVSYRESEYFAWHNAVLTAEGALQAAISASGKGLLGRPIAVLGFGRVGRSLAHRLSLLGAEVHVLDQEASHRASASSQGLIAHAIDPIHLGSIDMLFNTIPYPVITRMWERLLMDVPIFELASAPGGVAPEVDRAKLSLHVLSGLPGKTAPIRAAEIAWESVMGD